MRPVRCTNCQARFYVVAVPGEPTPRECQDCTGEHDNAEGAARDAELIRSANRAVRTGPQSIDPRNPSKKVK